MLEFGRRPWANAMEELLFAANRANGLESHGQSQAVAVGCLGSENNQEWISIDFLASPAWSRL
jgi:hypothetical protein